MLSVIGRGLFLAVFSAILAVSCFPTESFAQSSDWNAIAERLQNSYFQDLQRSATMSDLEEEIDKNGNQFSDSVASLI